MLVGPAAYDDLSRRGLLATVPPPLLILLDITMLAVDGFVVLTRSSPSRAGRRSRC